MSVFEERENPQYPGKNLSEHSKELRQHYGIESGIDPGHIGGKASALTTAPVSQSFRTVNFLLGYVFNLLK